MTIPSFTFRAILLVLLMTFSPVERSSAATELVESRQSGGWSEASTWTGGKVPAAGSSVRINEGHAVTYDRNSSDIIRAVFIAGTLTFARDRDTLLEAGLIIIQAGNDTSEEGFSCDAHLAVPDPSKPGPALEVGTWDKPVSAEHTARIRLKYFEGMDPQSCPAIVCCGGRMEFHGAEMNRTWVKLGAPARKGDVDIQLMESVTGWRKGDHVFLTGTTRQNKIAKTFQPTVRNRTQTEERIVASIKDSMVTLDKPLEFDHIAEGEYRGEIANLSRNVIVESADEGDRRGHTMFHRGSQGGISYAEFRHLGKEGVLGRYSIHFHLVRDTMRGASVIGASVWDSDNRWITIHGTDYLVVRDCVGYQSTGHGFFLEDGTEQFNVLDRNLAVQAGGGSPLPKQVLPYDHNDGAGFWWANCRNTFTRNVAAECDEYGYRFDAVDTREVSMTMNVPQPDGTRALTDIRTLPFVRFEDNESHCQRRHAFNLGGMDRELHGGVDGIGPDARHPLVVRGYKAWNVHWALHALSPSVMIDGADLNHAEYALWRMNYQQCALRGVRTNDIAINVDFSPQKGTRPAEANYPKPLDPVDDLPPVTIITHSSRRNDGTVLARGVTSDNEEVKRVVVNGINAKSLRGNYAEWEAIIKVPPSGKAELKAFSEDKAGNIESRPHIMFLP